MRQIATLFWWRTSDKHSSQFEQSEISRLVDLLCIIGPNSNFEFPGYCISAILWHYQRMGNKDSGRREKKKPKKQTPKPTAAPTANVVRQAPTRP
jgi:hypothetical protein